jgi:Arabinose-binding domain of AraC transcription regulator, N-term
MPGTDWISTDEIVSEHRIRAFAFSGLRELLTSRGVEIEPILAEGELSADAIKDDYAWVPLRKFANVLTFAARDTGDPYFGLKYGEAARFTSNPLGYLVGQRAGSSQRAAVVRPVQYRTEQQHHKLH